MFQTKYLPMGITLQTKTWISIQSILTYLMHVFGRIPHRYGVTILPVLHTQSTTTLDWKGWSIMVSLGSIVTVLQIDIHKRQ